MALPPAAAAALAALADAPCEDAGVVVLAAAVVSLLENPATRTIILGRIRSASSHPHAAALVRETVTRDLGRLPPRSAATAPTSERCWSGRTWSASR